ncbi:uncharacterized protein LOC112342837 [Selaginella moellendorffii]|uniref:uncharacterized protein LOC112342837 n=1 Tax=Selaginella moellendorffii TaxID=88036 RepID=UPI000D1CED6E|nr:uncharacterized protein LOC112342837 [Selaginella moellendorffii]|eukprot:XP_024521100.1 uncharacterized protein LOC112342837 [Selaginella moellendorffii]
MARCRLSGTCARSRRREARLSTISRRRIGMMSFNRSERRREYREQTLPLMVFEASVAYLQNDEDRDQPRPERSHELLAAGLHGREAPFPGKCEDERQQHRLLGICNLKQSLQQLAGNGGSLSQTLALGPCPTT